MVEVYVYFFGIGLLYEFEDVLDEVGWCFALVILDEETLWIFHFIHEVSRYSELCPHTSQMHTIIPLLILLPNLQISMTDQPINSPYLSKITSPMQSCLAFIILNLRIASFTLH